MDEDDHKHLHLHKEFLTDGVLRLFSARNQHFNTKPPIDRDAIDWIVCSEFESWRTLEKLRINDLCDDKPLHRDGPMFGGSTKSVRLQLKFVNRERFKRQGAAIELSHRAYDKLRQKSMNPQFIVVFVADKNPDGWLTQEQGGWLSSRMGSIALNSQSYWTSIAGEPEVEHSEEGVRVPIPQSNWFNADVLRDMVNKRHDFGKGSA